MGTQLPPEQMAHPPPASFWPMFIVAKRLDGCMMTPLGTEVDLGAGHIVLDGVTALRERVTAAPHLFIPCLLWPRLPISATAELFFNFQQVTQITFPDSSNIGNELALEDNSI